MIRLDHRTNDAVRVWKPGRDVKGQRFDPFGVDFEHSDDKIGARF
jgi:hypothetical protein